MCVGLIPVHAPVICARHTMAPKKVVMKHVMKAVVKQAASKSSKPKTSVVDVKLWAEDGDVLKRPSAALDTTRDRSKTYQFFEKFYTELPEHVKEMYQGTNNNRKTDRYHKCGHAQRFLG